MKILIVKPSSLGDVVHALPVLRLLKKQLPRSEIFWWVEAGLATLLAGDPDLAGIFTFQRKGWATPRNWPKIWAGARAVRRERFDWAIDLQGLARSALFAWLANADTTVGLDNTREGAREGARLYYDLIAPRAANGTHAVDRYLAVLPLLGLSSHGEFQWLPERPGIAALVREKWKPAGFRWVALLPGARWENKRWPVEHFMQVARRLAPGSAELKFAILGGRDDCALGRQIAEANPGQCLDLTGQTTLPEMIEWVRLSELVITNDTGPMHIAAALEKPVMALFGPTNPGGTGPYGQRHNVIQRTDLPCVPCMKGHCSYHEPLACLRGITPEMVCDLARARLNT